MFRALEEARAMQIEQSRVFREYSATFDPQVVQTWEALIAAWNSDPESHPDPYEEPESGRTIRLFLITISVSLTRLLSQ